MMLEAVAELEALVAKGANASQWSASSDDLVECLRRLHEAEQVFAVWKLHLIREIEGRNVPAAQHASSTAVWLREVLKVSIHTGRRLADLSRWVERRPALDAALSSGAINVEQAQVVAATVAGLPDDLDRGVVDAAETELITLADKWEPATLRGFGNQVLHYVAPEVAEEADRAALEREERRAQETRSLSLNRNGDGRVRVTGWLTDESAAIVNAALDPLCAPRRDDADEPRTPAQRRADALVEICELAMRTEELPASGGERPHLVVTLPYDLLRQQLGAGTLDTGERLTPEQVRRLGCDAAVIPVVLSGDGQVLDLGRSRRLITGSLRRALAVRDRGCAFPGCDRPAKWCHGHHIVSWVDGGETRLDNAVLLCGFHHRIIHKGHWIVRVAADGAPEFIPPHYIDAERKPRRNTYHHRC
jgi:hypothetical protein